MQKFQEYKAELTPYKKNWSKFFLNSTSLCHVSSQEMMKLDKIIQDYYS